MSASSRFEITRRNSGSCNVSLTWNGLGATGVLGLAVGAHLTDPEAGELASGTNFLGFLGRNVTLDGPTLEDRIFGPTGTTPLGPEFPVKRGDYVSVLKGADEVEVEGGDLVLLSGTGAITSTTPVGTPLSFTTGKFCVKQPQQREYFQLTAILTDVYEAGAVRIRAERIGS